MTEATAALEFLGLVFVGVFVVAAIYGACVMASEYARWRRRR